MSEKLSQRAFAKHVGCSPSWINKLVKSGKIPLDAKGKIDVAVGMKAYEASQQPGYENNREHAKKQRAASKSKKSGGQDVELPDDAPLTGGNATVEKVNQAFNKARLAEKTFMAKLRELEFKEKQGLLIPKEVVEADAANTAEELRGLLFAIGPRIAPLCEGKQARQIEAIIEEAINDALQALKKSRFKV